MILRPPKTYMADPLVAAEWVDIESITPWDRNPRQNDAAVASVAKSIERFGFGAPLLVRTADRVVIAGHTRLRAARELKLDKVPARFLDLDPAEARALALADNRLGEIAEWDAEQLEEILRELNDERPELVELTGWGDELDALLDGGDDDSDGDGDGDGDGELEYRVIVDCDGELQQSELVARLESEGLSCRPLIS